MALSFRLNGGVLFGDMTDPGIRASIVLGTLNPTCPP